MDDVRGPRTGAGLRQSATGLRTGMVVVLRVVVHAMRRNAESQHHSMHPRIQLGRAKRQFIERFVKLIVEQFTFLLHVFFWRQ